MTDLEVFQQTHRRVRAFYLSLPGRTEDGWRDVAMNPAQFNKVWRKALRLSVTGDPPPVDLRGVDWETGEDHSLPPF